jgi:hypothetical protein
MKVVPEWVQLFLMGVGFLCGVLFTWSILLRKVSFLEYRARLAERLLELERKFWQEDRARLEADLDFERQHVRRLQGFVDSLVDLGDRGQVK